jgi:hypothetical protein
MSEYVWMLVQKEEFQRFMFLCVDNLINSCICLVNEVLYCVREIAVVIVNL